MPFPAHPLKAARRRAGLTAFQLATEIGVRETTIYRIEAGTPPRIETALKIARALRCSVEDLFGQDGERSA
jgi:DNA-binding XRE family transcriptional regulator